MKTLFLLNDDDKYGAGKSSMKLIQLLKKYRDVEPIVITPKYNNNNKWCDENNVENYSIYYLDEIIGKKNKIPKKILKKRISLFFKSRAIKFLEQKIDFSTIDIIHTCYSGINMGMDLSNKYNIQHVWHLRDFPITWEFFNSNQLMNMNSSNTKFIAISEITKEKWIEIGLERKKIKTIYNGIDSEDVDTKVEEKNEELFVDKLKLVFAGALVEHKNPKVILQAFSYIPEEISKNIQLDFYGSVSEEVKSELLLIAKGNNIQDIVTFHGYSNQINKLLKNYDVGLMTSLSEPFGRITIEYMLAGLTVIASNAGANPEIIKNESLGFLFDLDNPKSLADIILKLYVNREICYEVASKSRIYANKNFSALLNAKNVYNLYTKIKK